MTTTLTDIRTSTQQRRGGGRTDSAGEDLRARAQLGLASATDALFAKQHEDGHWIAEFEGDSILSSEYLLMKVILGHHEAPAASETDLRRFRKLCAHLRIHQRDDGSWGQYPGSQPDLSAMVKAYFALKLFGDSRDAPHMVRARDAILALGGAEKINTFSMFYLACLGQVTWNAVPSIPPEIVFLPRWSPFHLDKVSAWTRAMILPLAICTAQRPTRRLPSNRGIGELFVDQANRDRLNQERVPGDPSNWTNIFLTIDSALKKLQDLNITPMRSVAIRRAESWLLERLSKDTTDGLGAIFPSMVYIQIAFQAMGYERSHPVIRNAERELDRFFVEKDDHARLQPCLSPVWDTGTALYAVTEAGLNVTNDARIASTCRWLLEKEVRFNADWHNNLRARDRDIRLGPGGNAAAWSFEYRNEWYPDVDDSAMVLMALKRAAGGVGETPLARRVNDAAERGVRWILAMQNDDGGWAAFDRTTDRPWLECVPFADHNAMQDPSCADITGRTIESLIANGLTPAHESVQQGMAYLRREQRPEGCWWGRWGVNFIYGTWQAIGGLAAAGEDTSQPYMKAALDWLRSVQNDDGGFGESADSYLDESLMGIGPSTPSQTAWAAITLMNLTGADDPAVGRAIAYLLDQQLREDTPAEYPEHPIDEPAGSWREEEFTGTGFPKVFYIRYHLYRHYFPLMALARYVRLRGASAGS